MPVYHIRKPILKMHLKYGLTNLGKDEKDNYKNTDIM